MTYSRSEIDSIRCDLDRESAARDDATPNAKALREAVVKALEMNWDESLVDVRADAYSAALEAGNKYQDMDAETVAEWTRKAKLLKRFLACVTCGHTPADKVQTDPGEGKCLGEAGILPGCPCGVDPGCPEYFEEVGQ
jgi:hypothetical protein